ncbi:SDR family oxidoreductase [Paenibacillus sp. J5C_2022]|uniref:SDR family NAD(P)-dependent oxidoreductase n=1 Tax=Paenibacillus sp. J5C2022 TaxID=2977129 RepID=UPI0021CE10A0|nr:SDR family oxidoreductase [Paenibacillus sp. J5C2022]MCU6709877.1 SDR family oxidoreductase [Paenibacillus sp. J5C2022]
MRDRLKGKSALVTGAGSGIGEATARLLADQGAKVAVVDVDGEKAETVSASINAAGGCSVAICADVSREEDVKNAVKRAQSRFSSLDILINNAAVQIMGELHDCTEEQFDRMIAVNLKGVFFGCKHVLPFMLEQKKGVILSTSSVLGVTGDADLGIYGATKGAVIALTKSMAVAYGSSGIRVNCVCPGDVGTPMVEQFFDFQPNPEAARERVYGQYPMRRIASPEEVAQLLAFLASDEASFITGSHMFVDGGLMASVY